MHVCFDGSAFENDHQRGVQRYLRGLIDHLPAGVEAEVLLNRRSRAALPQRGVARNLTPGILGALSRGARARLAAGPRRSRELAADVFHSGYYTLPTTDTPSVVTVYDMIVERFTDYYHNRWSDEEVERKRRAIEGATALVPISHAAARDLCLIYPSVRDRVTPVHLGIDHLPAARAPGARSGPDAFVLFVGDRGGYKNFRCILEAAAGGRWPRGVAISVVGSAPRANELTWAPRIGTINWLGRVDDDRLRSLYAHARATIVPSLAEGFGLPVLEAQRSGCPVVCSDIEVFREIAGNAAIWFDPTRPEQLADAVAQACDPAESLRLSTLGLINAAEYTWNRCAENTAEVYRRIARIPARDSRR